MNIYLNRTKTAIIIPKKDMQKMFKGMRLSAKAGKYLGDAHGICGKVEDYILDMTLYGWDSPIPVRDMIESNSAVCLRVRLEMKRCFKTWKEFSGIEIFPINVTEYAPKDEYRFQELWKGKQLQARIRLLKHLEKTTNYVSIPIHKGVV